MYEFRLPDIGEGLSEAELLEWLVAVGDRVSEGQEVALISTDKVNVDLTSPVAGTVTELLGASGDVIKVGTLIMCIDDGREPDSAAMAAGKESVQPGAEPAVHGSPAGDRPGPLKAAPIVRRYAAEHGVDLASVTGSGPGGQVLCRDVDAARSAPAPAPAVAEFQGRRLKLTAARLAAARRLSQADRLQVSTTIAFEVKSDLISRKIVELFDNNDKYKISPTAVMACCLAEVLGRHPHFNATISEAENELLMHDEINLGIAVDTEQGLMVPVIRGIGDMDLKTISECISKAAGRAREGTLAVQDVQHSTFTLSSTGSLEQATITATTPVINYPNAATLWISRIRDRPRVADGVLEAGPMMACSLSFDHRYLHGADGMAFINDLDSVLTDPGAACWQR